MNLNNYYISPIEKKNFYTLFCEIFTAFYCFATGKRLFKNKVYSWAIISYYYSLMHCGRSICFMSLNCFPKRHEDLHKILKGIDINNQKFWRLESPDGVRESHNIEEILNTLPVSNNLVKLKLEKLGEYLEKIKSIREFNSYEMFIVTHQINHRELSPALKNGTEKIDKIVREYLQFLLDLLHKHVREKSDEFKAFLLDKNEKNNWAFEYLKNSLKEQRFDNKIINEINMLIRERLLNKIFAQSECPDNFYNTISFGLFNEKSGIIKKFISKINEIEINETN